MKMFRAKPGTAALTKYRGELIQSDLFLSQADTVANTQRDSLDPYPAIIALQKRTVT